MTFVILTAFVIAFTVRSTKCTFNAWIELLLTINCLVVIVTRSVESPGVKRSPRLWRRRWWRRRRRTRWKNRNSERRMARKRRRRKRQMPQTRRIENVFFRYGIGKLIKTYFRLFPFVCRSKKVEREDIWRRKSREKSQTSRSKSLWTFSSSIEQEVDNVRFTTYAMSCRFDRWHLLLLLCLLPDQTVNKYIEWPWRS